MHSPPPRNPRTCQRNLYLFDSIYLFSQTLREGILAAPALAGGAAPAAGGARPGWVEELLAGGGAGAGAAGGGRRAAVAFKVAARRDARAARGAGGGGAGGAEEEAEEAAADIDAVNAPALTKLRTFTTRSFVYHGRHPTVATPAQLRPADACAAF